MVDIIKETSRFIEEGHIIPNDLYSILLERNDDLSLEQVLRLAKSDYAGITYKWELKSSALLLTLNWGSKGILNLREIIDKSSTHATLSLVLKFLAYVASSRIDLFPFCIKGEILNDDFLNSKKWKTEEIRLVALSSLNDILTDTERENPFPLSFMGSIFSSIIHPEVSEQVMTTLVLRWLNLNNSSIDNYFNFINSENFEELVYHNYLKKNPHLIEPLHLFMWSKPRFGESLQPDFLFRLMDDNYVVVEIEKPWLPILTKNGNLSSYTVHAKRQALEYREWAITNLLYARTKYPKIWRPFALVIIGQESGLNEKQIERLRQENESTQGILKIVGFDWLYDRYKATFNNLARYGFTRF